MKKKIWAFIGIIICCFSFALVGCSVLDENDKSTLNNAYNTMNNYVQNQTQTNQELISKLEKLTQEVENLKQEKQYSQNEIKAILNRNFISAMNNSGNFYLTSNLTRYINGKLEGGYVAVQAHVYEEATNTFKSMSYAKGAEAQDLFKEEVYNEQTEKYDVKLYDLNTGLEYIPPQGISVDFNMVDELYTLLKGTYDTYNMEENQGKYVYELVELEDDSIEIKVCDVYNLSESSISKESSYIFENGRIKSISQIQSGIDSGNLMKMEGLIEFEYISELNMEDHIIND